MHDQISSLSREQAALLRAVLACDACATQFAQLDVPHHPRPVIRLSSSAKLCICGQAPGTRVHASGVPFDDRSGERLREWMGIGPDVFYDTSKVAIVPMAFCFPGTDARGGDLPPPRRCAELWRERVFQSMPQLELILLVGKYAQQWHLSQRSVVSLTETVRDWRSYLPSRLPLPHPSWRNNHWLRRNPWFERELLPELRRRVRALVR